MNVPRDMNGKIGDAEVEEVVQCILNIDLLIDIGEICNLNRDLFTHLYVERDTMFATNNFFSTFTHPQIFTV